MLSSVAEYFPSAGYLVDVTVPRSAAGLGGALTLGMCGICVATGVRDGVQLEGADGEDTAAAMREQVRGETLGERELSLAPDSSSRCPAASEIAASTCRSSGCGR